MRASWNGVLRGASLLVLLVAIGVPSVFADETTGPFDPPEARIKPPGGVTSQSRILPPSGVTAPEPTFFELLIEWLRVQAQILPPVG